MPVIDARVATKPSTLERICSYDGPAEDSGECSSESAVVSRMNPLLCLLSELVAKGAGFLQSIEFGSEEVCCIFGMKVDSGEDVIFQFLIARFTCDYEGIGAGKIGLDHYM